MKQYRCFGDERQLGFCVLCGNNTNSRDHCPSRVLLDKPYPENVPVIQVCKECNSQASLDEEYFACLVSCAMAGTADPEKMPREKIKRILQRKPALRSRLEQAMSIENGNVFFSIEEDRVTRVVTKLAKGHALYELHEPCIEEPLMVECVPLSELTDVERDNFENPPPTRVGPEVGSRALYRLVEMNNSFGTWPWVVVQDGVYRYHASQDKGNIIRIVIQEYLACQVSWA